MSLPRFVLAINHHVRTGATGNNDGTSWQNAWNELNQINWTMVQPGDSIEIAAGTYSSLLKVSASGTLADPIIIKRTIEPMYAGLVNINNFIDIVGSNIIFDGSINNGIKLVIPPTGEYVDGHYIDINNGSNIIIKNIEIEGPGYNQCHAARGIQGDSDNILVDNAYIHNFSGTAFRLVGNDGFTIQNSWLHNIYSKGDTACQAERGLNVHFEHIAVFGGVRNFELKRSLISQQYNGVLTPGFGISMALLNGGYVRIHDNVFFNTSYPIYINSDGLGTVNEYIVNGNTFVGYRTPIGGIPNDARNNIFCNLDIFFADSSTRSAYTGGSHNLYCDDDRYRSSYNAAINRQLLTPGEQPFVNFTSNWKLRYATDAGASLQSLYSSDFNNNVRGTDGVWDRGAYEYIGTAPHDTTPPASPTGLNIN